MTTFGYTMTEPPGPRIGLVALQSDETIERDFRALFPAAAELLVSRVPSGAEVTPETLAGMDAHLTAAAALFPRGLRFDAVGYGCTSGTAEIGADRVAARLRAGCAAGAVSEPVSALVAACRALGLVRLALLSPYIAPVSENLRRVLAGHGIATPVFGTFAEAEEARVVRIDPASILAAATALAEGAEVDGVFLSCTNLRTLEVIEPLTRRLGLPVLSSNQVLAWHLLALCGVISRHAAFRTLSNAPAPDA